MLPWLYHPAAQWFYDPSARGYGSPEPPDADLRDAADQPTADPLNAIQQPVHLATPPEGQDAPAFPDEIVRQVNRDGSVDWFRVCWRHQKAMDFVTLASATRAECPSCEAERDDRWSHRYRDLYARLTGTD